jgi:hypothetical protein
MIIIDIKNAIRDGTYEVFQRFCDGDVNNVDEILGLN